MPNEERPEAQGTTEEQVAGTEQHAKGWLYRKIEQVALRASRNAAYHTGTMD